MSIAAARTVTALDIAGFMEFLDSRPRERWELHDGVPRAMVGGTFAHASISANIVATIRNAAQSKGCHALGGFLVSIGESSAYEPDAVVICGDVDRGSRVTDRPTIVFEVLSPSTMHFDRSEKAQRYRAIASLQQLVFVYQDSVRVESWLRQDEGWSRAPKVLVDREDSLALPSLAASLPLQAIYADIVPTPFED